MNNYESWAARVRTSVLKGNALVAAQLFVPGSISHGRRIVMLAHKRGDHRAERYYDLWRRVVQDQRILSGMDPEDPMREKVEGSLHYCILEAIDLLDAFFHENMLDVAGSPVAV